MKESLVKNEMSHFYGAIGISILLGFIFGSLAVTTLVLAIAMTGLAYEWLGKLKSERASSDVYRAAWEGAQHERDVLSQDKAA